MLPPPLLPIQSLMLPMMPSVMLPMPSSASEALVRAAASSGWSEAETDLAALPTMPPIWVAMVEMVPMALAIWEVARAMSLSLDRRDAVRSRPMPAVTAFIAGAMPLPSVKTLATELATFSNSMPVLRFLSDFLSEDRESYAERMPEMACEAALSSPVSTDSNSCLIPSEIADIPSRPSSAASLTLSRPSLVLARALDAISISAAISRMAHFREPVASVSLVMASSPVSMTGSSLVRVSASRVEARSISSATSSP